MIIDAHNHPDWHKHNFEAFISNMDANEIDKTWLLSWETPYGDFDPETAYLLCGPVLHGERSVPIPFERCLEYKRRAPDRFILGYAPDPHRADALLALRFAVDMYDVKVCGEIKFRLLYDDPDCVDLFRFCGEAHLPVTLHFDYAKPTRTGRALPRRHYWYGGGIENLENLLSLCPNTAFLGHAPGFWAHISGEEDARDHVYRDGKVLAGGKIEELLGKYKNLYCDISAGSGRVALSRDPEYAYKLICRFPDRFLYARDYFDGGHRAFLDSLSLPAEVRELVYHGNAERLIGEA